MFRHIRTLSGFIYDLYAVANFVGNIQRSPSEENVLGSEREVVET